MESQEQIDNANLLLTQHRLKLEWNQMVWSVNNLRCGTAVSDTPVSEQPLAASVPNGEKRRARLAANGKLGLLRIGFIPTAGVEIVPNIIRQFRELNPEVEVSMRAITTECFAMQGLFPMFPRPGRRSEN